MKMAETGNIHERIKVFENVTHEFELEPLNMANQAKKKSNSKCQKLKSFKSSIKHWFKTSRLAGLPLAILFGGYFYYLVALLILDGVDDIELTDFKGALDHDSSDVRQIVEVECIKKVYDEQDIGIANTTSFNDTSWERYRTPYTKSNSKQLDKLYALYQHFQKSYHWWDNWRNSYNYILSTSIYDLVLTYVCHFHHHFLLLQ